MDDELERGRAACARRAWAEAHESLVRVDAASPLAVDDVEQLATAAYMLGRDDESMSLLERAHHAHLEAGETHRSVRCALWVCMHHASRGELGPAGGWLARAERLLGDEDCAERGYLLIPAAFGAEAAGDFETAAATAASAAEIGQRFGDADLYALAAHMNGQFVIQEGRVDEGFRLLDEAMVTATSGSVSPIVTGLVYCGVILACVEDSTCVGRRSGRRCSPAGATTSPGSWRSPAAASCTGRRSCSCTATGRTPSRRRGGRPSGSCRGSTAPQQRRPSTGRARCSGSAGRLDEAEGAYGASRRFGWEPLPGLALLRLAQGRPEAAAAAIRRVLGETTVWSRRAVLLPALGRDRARARTSSRRRATPPSS